MLAGPFLGLGATLLPAQILWINLLTHGVPGVALGVEPAESDVLSRRPRPPGEGILARGLVGQILRLAAVLAAASLGLALWAHGAGRPWQSMLFASLALGQLWAAPVLRTGGRRLTGNPFLIAAVAADAALVFAALYVPWLQALLGTEPLGGADLALVLAVSLAGAGAVAVEHAAHHGRGQRSPRTAADADLGPCPRRSPGTSVDLGGAPTEGAAMRAIVYRGAGKKDWQEVPDPRITDPTERSAPSSPPGRRHDPTGCSPLLAGQLDVSSFITHRLGMADFLDAYEVFADPPGRVR